MFKAYDTEKFHFIEGDTDSMYWAVAGDPTKPITQDFDEIIKDRKYYDRNVHEFLPNNTITDRTEKIKHEKKLLGCCVEKRGEEMIALAPKVYTIINKTGSSICKVKGVSKNRNKELIKPGNYLALATGKELVIQGRNMSLQMKKQGMTKTEQLKTALSNAHTKMRVQADGSVCLPFIYKPERVITGEELVNSPELLEEIEYCACM